MAGNRWCTNVFGYVILGVYVNTCEVAMKNYDPFKKIIIFISSLINIVMLTGAFALAWTQYYSGKMYQVQFYYWGNWAVLGLYGVLLLFFSKVYGGLRIGQLRRIEVILSQMLSVCMANFIIYMVICLLSFGLANPLPLLLMTVADTMIVTIWSVIIIKFYNKIFQPWKILLIYDRQSSAEDLVYKVEARRDKYAIYDAIHIDEGLEVIGEKMKDFQAVIIGDIVARKRNDILKYCYTHRVRAYVVPKLSDIILMGADRIHVFDTPFLLTKGYTLSADERFAKRLLDIVLSLLLLVVLSPVFGLVALAVKLQDGGPVFYKQVRATIDEKTFDIIKFRSMVVNAEQDGVAVLAKEQDTRITAVGRFLRATRLDELPQLVNILRGDMSFVGPRPERPEIIKQYQEEMPEFGFRMRVKAGLTGFAQIYGKYNTSPYDKLKLDLFYIENYSFWMDVKLIIMTVKTVLIKQKESTQGVGEEQDTAWKPEDENAATVEDLVTQIVEETERKL